MTRGSRYAFSDAALMFAALASRSAESFAYALAILNPLFERVRDGVF